MNARALEKGGSLGSDGRVLEGLLRHTARPNADARAAEGCPASLAHLGSPAVSSLVRGVFQKGLIPKLQMGKLRHSNKPGGMGRLRVSCSPGLPAALAGVPAW